MTILLASQRVRLYDSKELDDVLQAMAHKAATLLPPTHAALIGIQRRGEPLAQRLREYIAHRTGQPQLPLYPLQVKRYADDLQVLHTYTQLTENPALGGLDLANTTLLVVDDVLFEGHSLLRTCAYLAQLGARRVHTAVLYARRSLRRSTCWSRSAALPGNWSNSSPNAYRIAGPPSQSVHQAWNMPVCGTYEKANKCCCSTRSNQTRSTIVTAASTFREM
ncbi:phosphoribosyltransferase [Pseudomonas frederiksbergensis]|uniref:phosphoribosyltransferase n=1 Tax=Pseudomonas frederiksbergensis TaxID=104087 RepID=UPI000AA7FC42|nr:phosphoribosyltransferase [Pseudomonas frederiksbergensis]